MANLINIASKQSGDTLTAGEVNSIVDTTNAAIAEHNTTKEKVNGIEEGATGDQTGAEIKAAYEAEADTNAFTDSLKAKLEGVEEGATAGGGGLEFTSAHKLICDTLKQDLVGVYDNEAAINAAHPDGTGLIAFNTETGTLWAWFGVWADTTITFEHSVALQLVTRLSSLTGDDRLDASAIKNLPSGGGGVVDITYANAITAMNNGTLTAGSLYKITDRGDRGLFFTAISTSKFAKNGTRLMLCPATYATGADGNGNTWVGIWHSTKSASVDNLAIWGGKVWKNLTGVIGTATDEVTLDSTNWVEIPKSSFSNSEYIEMVFGIQFDWDNDWINIQWDDNSNYFGSFKFMGATYNPADVSDWNLLSDPTVMAFAGNRCMSFSNNLCSMVINNVMPFSRIINNYVAMISMNSCFMDINDNNNPMMQIMGNSNDGSIEGNSCTAIVSNSCKAIGEGSGSIRNNTNTGSIWYNSNAGEISGNSNAGVIEYNHNLGSIQNNSIDGGIIFNANTGHISVNSSSAPCDIKYNNNFGNISGSWSADVEDARVHKS